MRLVNIEREASPQGWRARGTQLISRSNRSVFWLSLSSYLRLSTRVDNELVKRLLHDEWPWKP